MNPLNSTKTNLTIGKVSSYQYQGKGSQSFLWDSKVSGLGVRVTKPSKLNPVGDKKYVFQSRLKNKESIRLLIGNPNAVTLEDARAKAILYQNQINDGRDPREIISQAIASDMASKQARAKAKQEKELQGRLTLKALCEAYCEDLKARGKIKSATDTFSAFRCHVFTTPFANLPAREIKSENIAQIIRQVLESGKERTAGILRNYLVGAYNSARKAPYNPKALSTLIPFEITSNPAEVIPTIPVRRGDRVLNKAELKKYLSLLGDSPIDQFLRLNLYIGGQRIEQLARTKLTDYQSETGILRLIDPKGRRSVGKERFVPLASKAIEIIEGIPKGKDLLFAVNCTSDTLARRAGTRVSEINREIGGVSFNCKDIRRTCETKLAEMGISKQVRAKLLSHGDSGVQDAHYDRYDYHDEMRKALTAWEIRLDEILHDKPAKSNVTSLKKIVA